MGKPKTKKDELAPSPAKAPFQMDWIWRDWIVQLLAVFILVGIGFSQLAHRGVDLGLIYVGGIAGLLLIMGALNCVLLRGIRRQLIGTMIAYMHPFVMLVAAYETVHNLPNSALICGVILCIRVITTRGYEVVGVGAAGIAAILVGGAQMSREIGIAMGEWYQSGLIAAIFVLLTLSWRMLFSRMHEIHLAHRGTPPVADRPRMGEVM